MLESDKDEMDDDLELENFDLNLSDAVEKNQDYVVKKHFAAGQPVYYIDGNEPQKGLITKEYPSGKKEYIPCQH